ncbi:MAG: ABC transporter permease [Lachnospiraceae bacterium]|nr:ABC transporter permease [Lachnospiraceae bacterium]
MNWYSLAYKNIRKSMRDYVVYFLTLIFGVAIFYIFNSVGDQSAILSLSETGYEFIKLMLMLLEMLSIGVAFVLGFLIIYANKFLIQRRKKEFGIYLLLGMNKRDVSKVLIGETFLVGMLSLVAGIGIGIFVSQFVSILLAKFFEADMSNYVFTISVGAVIKTIINFMVIYLVVLLFHSVTISKLKLIDLISAEKKAEKQKFKNPVLAMIVFLVSVAALGVAYYRVAFCGSEVMKKEMLSWILVGIISTFLLFWSMSGFLLSSIKKVRGFYYKELNSFVARQFCKSINSSVVSMGIICLMLFSMICTFSGGLSVAHQLQENVRKMTPVDFSIIYFAQEPIEDCLKREGMPLETWAEDYVELPIYHTENMTWETGLGDVATIAKQQFPVARWNTPENIMSLTDYNTLASMYGLETYECKENEYLIVCDFLLLKEFRDSGMAQGVTRQIGASILKPALSQCVEGYLGMSGMNNNLGIVVVPDIVIEKEKSSLQRAGYVMAGNYIVTSKEEKKEMNGNLWEAASAYTVMDYNSENPIPSMTLGTQVDIRESNNGLTMIVAFVVIYIGIVFLIASAAMLSLKALSESIDSTGKYEILKKIGCESRNLKKALFLQIGVYFILPLVVAIIHSVFGLQYVSYVINAFTRQNIVWGVLVTGILLIVLYGGYLLATYSGSKRIVGLED